MAPDQADLAASDLYRSGQRVLLTGAAGFIGSHLLETLLKADNTVVAIDNFATGHPGNLEDVKERVGDQWSRVEFIEGDIRDLSLCHRVSRGVDTIFHQAALGSVPRSLEQPLASHANNVDGFLNLLEAARTEEVPRFIYASSSSVYGDHPDLPKREAATGRPLSPYAATKRVDEVYAQTYSEAYGIRTIGLRYFNVFGPRQDPNGPYAAVIPRWLFSLLSRKRPTIFGDGETSRDFCPVANVVQANLRAALASPDDRGEVYNVALGGRSSLRQLFAELTFALAERGVQDLPDGPEFSDFRPGDVRHSHADISRARADLGYEPDVDFAAGVGRVVDWALTLNQTTWPPQSS